MRIRAGSFFQGSRGSRKISSSDLFVTPQTELRSSEQQSPKTRIRVLGLIGMIAIGVLIIRSTYLDASNAIFRTRAEGNRVRLLVQYAPRGVMFDAHGEQLVQNIPTTDLVAYPAQLPLDTEELLTALRDVFPETPVNVFQEQLLAAEPESSKPVPLLSGITDAQRIAVLARSQDLPGIGVESRAVREYGNEQIFSHLIGYTGRITKEELETMSEYLSTESVGKSGLEKQYEHLLRGRHGAQQVEVDAAGNIQDNLGTVTPVPGTNLRLHVDAALQRTLAKALSSQAQKVGARKAVGVAIDPRSGAVRALVSLPLFDHGALARGISAEDAQKLFSDTAQPLLNRVTQGEYPPGSTFKLSVSATALEERVANRVTTVESTGGIHVGQWFFPDWKAGGHGQTNIMKAIAESVNTFFYIVGGGYGDVRGLGIDGIVRGARILGFGAKTDIDLPGERDGFLPSPEWKKEVKGESWYIGDTYHAAIGQGDILITPLQLASATAVIANNGTLYAPRVVDASIRTDGSTIETFPPVIHARNVLRPDTTETIREGMRMAVTDGSARGLSTLPVAVAAKTGTAQIGGSDNTHAWVTTFAPYEQPDLVLTVLVEQGGGGDKVAVPVAREVLQWYYGGRPDSEHVADD